MSLTSDTPKAPQLFAAVPTTVDTAEDRLRALFEDTATGMASLDLAGRILETNQALQELLETGPEALAGCTFTDIGLREDAEAEWAAFQRLLAGEQQDHHVGDKRIPHKDGETLHVDWRVSVVTEANGEPHHAVLVVQDVTERQAVEAQQRQAQKLEAVGRLVGGMAHHFNNALAVINGYAEVLLMGDDLGERQRSFLEEIRNAGQQAASLTKQLLVFGLNRAMVPPEIDLNGVLAQMGSTLQTTAGENVDLVLDLAPNLGIVRADPREMGQVIQNLVANGRDAMPNGGTVKVETVNVELAGAYSQRHDVTPGPYVLLSVNDTGMGMDRETLSHIFEPFFTTKEVGQGTGLGMSTVYGIVRQSNGHISVTSDLGKGTSCKIYLPRVEEEEPPPQPASKPSFLGGLRKTDFVRPEETPSPDLDGDP